MYEYKDPLNEGYQQFKLTTKQHNKLFEYRPKRWYDYYEYYYNENAILLHRFTNWFGVILETIAYPLTVLLEGLRDLKYINKEIYSLYHQKKCGSFSSHTVWRSSEKYSEIINEIKEREQNVYKNNQ